MVTHIFVVIFSVVLVTVLSMVMVNILSVVIGLSELVVAVRLLVRDGGPFRLELGDEVLDEPRHFYERILTICGAEADHSLHARGQLREGRGVVRLCQVLYRIDNLCLLQVRRRARLQASGPELRNGG